MGILGLVEQVQEVATVLKGLVCGPWTSWRWLSGVSCVWPRQSVVLVKLLDLVEPGILSCWRPAGLSAQGRPRGCSSTTAWPEHSTLARVGSLDHLDAGALAPDARVALSKVVLLRLVLWVVIEAAS